MTYKLLDKIPLSGTAPEYFFGNHQEQVAWFSLTTRMSCGLVFSN